MAREYEIIRKNLQMNGKGVGNNTKEPTDEWQGSMKKYWRTYRCKMRTTVYQNSTEPMNTGRRSWKNKREPVEAGWGVQQNPQNLLHWCRARSMGKEIIVEPTDIGRGTVHARRGLLIKSKQHPVLRNLTMHKVWGQEHHVKKDCKT